MVEATRVSMRNVRREMNEKLKKMEKDKTLSKDDLFKLQEEVQKMTDRYIALSSLFTPRKKKRFLNSDSQHYGAQKREATPSRCHHHGWQRPMGNAAEAAEA